MMLIEGDRQVKTKESCQTHRQLDSNKENNTNSQGYFTSLNDYESVQHHNEVVAK